MRFKCYKTTFHHNLLKLNCNFRILADGILQLDNPCSISPHATMIIICGCVFDRALKMWAQWKMWAQQRTPTWVWCLAWRRTLEPWHRHYGYLRWASIVIILILSLKLMCRIRHLIKPNMRQYGVPYFLQKLSNIGEQKMSYSYIFWKNYAFCSIRIFDNFYTETIFFHSTCSTRSWHYK